MSNENESRDEKKASERTAFNVTPKFDDKTVLSDAVLQAGGILILKNQFLI